MTKLVRRILSGLFTLVAGSCVGFATETANSQPARTAAIGPQYRAGAFHRWLWGADYRLVESVAPLAHVARARGGRP
jgi:hypothetical protein